MDADQYFGQEEHYFSESAGQLIPIAEMPFQQAFYSHRKLLREFGKDYQSTNLYWAFIRKLMPTPAEIRRQLQEYGKACHFIFEPGMAASTNGTRVRSKFYHAAKIAGKKVTTHKVDTSAGSYIEASIPVTMVVTRKGERIA